jgi:hypothetical protein
MGFHRCLIPRNESLNLVNSMKTKIYSAKFHEDEHRCDAHAVSRHESWTLNDIRQSMETESELQIQFVPILCNLLDHSIAFNETCQVAMYSSPNTDELKLTRSFAGSGIRSH